MGIAIGFSSAVAIGGIVIAIVVLVRKKAATCRKNKPTNESQPQTNVEVSLSETSNSAMLNLSNSAKQGNAYAGEYEDVVSLSKDARQYESLSTDQSDEQNHIYSEL